MREVKKIVQITNAHISATIYGGFNSVQEKALNEWVEEKMDEINCMLKHLI